MCCVGGSVVTLNSPQPSDSNMTLYRVSQVSYIASPTSGKISEEFNTMVQRRSEEISR